MEPLEVLALGTIVLSMAGVGLAWAMSRAFDRTFGSPRAIHVAVVKQPDAAEVKASGYATRTVATPAHITARVHIAPPPPQG